MYILVKPDGTTQYPYSVHQLKVDNRNTSFQESPSVEVLEYFGVYGVEDVEQPEFDTAIQRVEEGTPILSDGVWRRTWDAVDIPDRELEEIKLNNIRIQNDQHKAFLKNTDWYVIRFMETGTPIPDHIAQLRQDARASIDE
jgi:hypothetical protein